MDDFDDGHLSEEDDTVLLGGGGFSHEELAAAEERLNEQLVCHAVLQNACDCAISKNTYGVLKKRWLFGFDGRCVTYLDDTTGLSKRF